MVIVRDIWLTGFDCPSLHTLYIDKPMDGHNLMQAIAQVNRVFRDKPGGLVVDYIGLADSLKKALADYSAGGGKGDTTIDQEQAAALLIEKYEVARESDEFLKKAKNLPHKNLVIELLTKLPDDEIETRSKKNVAQARSFGDMLKTAVAKYQNRMIEAAAIIQELIELARELRESDQRGERPGLNDDALADNCSARALMGDEQLCAIAQILVRRVKNSVSIDWTAREGARANPRDGEKKTPRIGLPARSATGRDRKGAQAGGRVRVPVSECSPETGRAESLRPALN